MAKDIKIDLAFIDCTMKDINHSVFLESISSANADVISNLYINYKHCLVWSGMPADECRLSPTDARQLLLRTKAWMLRNCYNWDCERETNFWEIICDTPHKLEDYPPRIRTYIRKSLKECSYRIITTEELIQLNGYDVYCKSFTRYFNIASGPVEFEKWREGILNSKYEIWGAFSNENNELIGFSLNTIIDRAVSYSTLKAIPEFLNSKRTFYGLFYTMNQYYLSDKKFKYVTDGWRSVTEHSNIQPFLEQKFMFRKAYCSMQLYYVPWLNLAVKLLYPLRHWKILPLNVRNVLKFEEINRQCY